MGQSSIPILNRVGYSMFWTSVWNENHNYTKVFKEDVLIRKYINCIVDDKISSNLLNFSKKITFTNFYKNFKKSYSIHLNLSKDIITMFLFKFNKLPVYISKIHIIRLNTWVVIYFICSTPDLKKKNLKSTVTDNYFFVQKEWFLNKKKIFSF